jgi:hypothetical protein
MEHSLIMLVYNIKRSINILGVSDLIAKTQKTHLQSNSLFCLYNELFFRLYKESITNQLQFAA